MLTLIQGDFGVSENKMMPKGSDGCDYLHLIEKFV
jgi:hypothetical protein